MGKSYVITIMDNEKSVKSAERLIQSGKQYGAGIKMWPATTPKDNPEIMMRERQIDPEGFKEVYSRHENCMAAFLSHYRLWEECAFRNETFTIYEHDAVLVSHPPGDIALQMVGTIGAPSYGKYNNPLHIGWGPLTQKPYFGGAHAYMVKPKGAWALMEQAQSNASPTDVFLNKTNFPWIQEWYPWVAEVKDTFTTIQKTKGCLAKHNYNDMYEIEDV